MELRPQIESAELLLDPLFRKLKSLSSVDTSCHKTFSSKSSENILSLLDEVRYHLYIISQVINSITESSSNLDDEIPVSDPCLKTAFADISDLGNSFRNAVSRYTSNPTSVENLKELQSHCRALLLSFNRLLILTDHTELARSKQFIHSLVDELQYLTLAETSKKLESHWDTFQHQLSRLTQSLEHVRDEPYSTLNCQIQNLFIALRSISPILNTSSKASVQHPNEKSVSLSREFAGCYLRDCLAQLQLCMESDEGLADVISAKSRLTHQLNEFENCLLINTNHQFNPSIHQQLDLELDKLIVLVRDLLSDVAFARGRGRAVAESLTFLNQVARQLLATLSSRSPDRIRINDNINDVLNALATLKNVLARATLDLASEAFLNFDHCLMSMSDAAVFGNRDRLELKIAECEEQMHNILTGSVHVCALSPSAPPIESIVDLLNQLSPLTSGLTRSVASHPSSQTIGANFDSHKSAIDQQLDRLQTLILYSVSLHDFLAVSDERMLGNFEAALQALKLNDQNSFQINACLMQRRLTYICNIVTAILQNQSTCFEFTEQIMDQVACLQNQHGPTFQALVHETVSKMAANQPINDKLFRATGNRLCTGLHDLRLSALEENSTYEEFSHPSRVSDDGIPLPLDNSNEEDDQQKSIYSMLKQQEESQYVNNSSPSRSPPSRKSNRASPKRPTAPSESARRQAEWFGRLSPVHRETIMEEVVGVLKERKRFLQEVVIWDDSANKIIALTKQMSSILMQMTDFIRGKGPIQSTAEVYQTAQHISTLGNRLVQFCQSVTEKSPDSINRRDLAVYLQRVTLYCHQLNITSRVKAEIRQSSQSEMFDNTTSLLQTARNLMSAVILTVKQSYVVSTECKSAASSVKWKICVPDKKPLAGRMNQSPVRNNASPTTDDIWEMLAQSSPSLSR